MKLSILPTDIFNELKKEVIGQDEVLKFVSVAIFKHLLGEKLGNLILIGNSGTGKTTIMKAIEKLYQSNPVFEKFRVVVRVNANILTSEEGTVTPAKILFNIIEDKARSILKEVDENNLKEYMEHTTVCLDEIDKIGTKIGDKPYVAGITIQQALLTLMEGEQIFHEVTIAHQNNFKKVSIPIDTSHILFICAGAFERLYDNVRYRVVVKEKKNLFKAVLKDDGKIEYQDGFTLREYLRQEDLFEYGMLPQFLSRFDNWLVMNDLGKEELKYIFSEPPDAIFKLSQNFFQKFNIELGITDEAKTLIAEEAAKYSRVGARALRDIYNKVIKEFEYDPFSKREVIKKGDGSYKLTIDKHLVKKSIQ